MGNTYSSSLARYYIHARSQVRSTARGNTCSDVVLSNVQIAVYDKRAGHAVSYIEVNVN